MNSKNLLATRNGRFTTFGLLYVSEGIPYGFTSVAMVAFMRQHGVSLDLIGTFVAALFMPWAFKWAWAPLVDLIKLHRWGGRRAWIIACNAMMIVTLLITGSIDVQQNFTLLLIMVTLHNFFCATQDVAIDSLAVSTLEADERGRGNGFMFAGQYFGIMLGGGGAVFVNGLFGFDAALAYICALLLLNLSFVLLFVRDPFAQRNATRAANFTRTLVTSLIKFVKEVYASFWLSGRGPIIGVAFSLLPAGAMALAYATLATIQVDYGLDDNQIAKLQTLNTLAAATGCIVGGMFGDRFGAKRAIAIAFALTASVSFALATQISEVGLVAVAPSFFYGIIIAHGFFFGMAYGARNAIFMSMTNPAVAATQFTAFMGMSNLAISFGNYWQGIVAERMGYAQVLYLDAGIALLVICLIPFLRAREGSSGRTDSTAESALPAPVPVAD
ncbi:MAG: MFS transporter [Steroidobacteraceae bacterium]|nr:MFS transporter [Steroidobacteraceae bacterium]